MKVVERIVRVALELVHQSVAENVELSVSEPDTTRPPETGAGEINYGRMKNLIPNKSGETENEYQDYILKQET
jgi:hypothetical protein